MSEFMSYVISFLLFEINSNRKETQHTENHVQALPGHVQFHFQPHVDLRRPLPQPTITDRDIHALS